MAKTAIRLTNGTGIGLYMAKDYMDSILIVENIDQGICFIIILPIPSFDEIDNELHKNFHT